MRRLFLSLILLLLLSSTLMAQAQNNIPQQIQDALADLNRRLGTNLTISNLSNWTYEQLNYPDASLGCPQTGMIYAQQVTNAYHVTLNYNGIAYDYRVSTDRSILILCTPGATGPSASGVGVQPIPTATAIPIPTGQVYCPGGMNIRLWVGGDARSIATGSVNIRQSPGTTSTVTGLLLPDGMFRVTGGPNCVGVDTWWQINYPTNGQTVIGWVKEGDPSSNDYWLQPVGTGPTVSDVGVQSPSLAPGSTPITTGTASSVGQYFQAAFNFPIRDAAFVPGTPADIVVLTESGMLEYYSGTTGRPTNMLGSAGVTYLDVALAPKDAATVLMATVEQNPDNASALNLRIWDVQLGEHPTSVQVYGYQLPFGATNQLAFSQSGILAVSTGVQGQTVPNAVWLWNGRTGQQMNMLAHSDPVLDLAFTMDGSRLATSTFDGAVHLWDMSTFTESATLPDNTASLGAKQSLAFSPDGSLLAVGSNDGKVSIWTVSTRTALVPAVQLYTVGALWALAFSPDGSLLATGSPSDEPIYLIDVRTGMRYQQLTHSDGIFGLQFTSDGTQLNSADTQQFSFWRAGS